MSFDSSRSSSLQGKDKKRKKSIDSSNSSIQSHPRKAHQKTLGMAWGANSVSSSKSSARNSPFSDFGSYMEEKNRKLRNQFDADASKSSLGDSSGRTDLFRGIAIFVDGFTIPSSQELRGYMLKHGGRFENYFSRNRVTHIVCSNLADSKIRNLRSFSRGLPVVKPTWVLDSVAANRVLNCATLSKGINRGIGTILGGGLGCLAALLAQILAQKAGRTGSAIAISISVFFFGAAATYSRLIPSIKKKFDYGFLIFMLTFNLVAVSGFRCEAIIKLAGMRLSKIAMGVLICVITSLLVFPVWAGDELHRSLVSKFDNLALSIEECLKEYFQETEEKPEGQASTHLNSYKSVLDSKAADEALANFARWEPWHGKFRFSYPWNKYLRIGELLRELAASVLTLRECLQSHQQLPLCLRLIAKEPCEEMGTQICSTLRELRDGIFKMRKLRRREYILQSDTLQTTRQELHSVMCACVRGTILASENGDVGDLYPIATFVFMLMEIVSKVERLVKEVEELGDPAGFCSQ